MPFSTPKWSVDRDDWGDVPDDIRDQTGFTGDNMLRDPGGSGPTVQDSSRMGGADLIASESYLLYWQDFDTNSTGGIRVGARLEGGSSSNSSPADFDVQMGGETKTVPGSDQPASANTPYHVYWIEGDAAVSISTTKSDAIGYDRIYLGRITTGDDETGGGSSGGDTGGDDDDRTLK